MTKFNENSDLIMTYLGRLSMVRDHKMVVEERFPMSGQRFTDMSSFLEVTIVLYRNIYQ